jgi:hypothetical protein
MARRCTSASYRVDPFLLRLDVFDHRDRATRDNPPDGDQHERDGVQDTVKHWLQPLRVTRTGLRTPFLQAPNLLA